MKCVNIQYVRFFPLSCRVAILERRKLPILPIVPIHAITLSLSRQYPRMSREEVVRCQRTEKVSSCRCFKHQTFLSEISVKASNSRKVNIVQYDP
jgi:hypothetical protein